MKCVYVGDFRKPYSSENYVAYGLRENGVEVIEWQETREAPTKAVFEHIVSLKPDFVLFCKNRLFGRGDLLMEWLNEAGILTVTWLFDLYFDLPPEMGAKRTIHDSPFKAKLVFTSDGGHDEAWKEHGITHYTLRQGIHEPEAVLGTRFNVPPVAFVGSTTYNKRENLLRALRERYKDDFRHYGIGGNTPEIRGIGLNNLLISTKVVVGDSVPSKNYWSNRIYEVLGRGGFLIHPKVGGLDEEFTPYKHYIPYDHGNHAQLFEIVDYYLSHDKEREAIRLAGHEHVKTNYTYTIRCRSLLKKITGINEPKT